MMTAQEYVESLRKLKTRVYMFGEKIENWGRRTPPCCPGTGSS